MDELHPEVTVSIANGVVSYQIKIISGGTKSLCVNDERNTPVYVSLEGAIRLESSSSASSAYCDLKLQPIVPENIYNVPTLVCSSCKHLYECDGEVCAYGHKICVECKNNSCAACGRVVATQTRVNCVNKYCDWTGSSLEWRLHEDDCLHAIICCPYQNCPWRSNEMDLKVHAVFHKVHGDILEQPLRNEDGLWLMDYAGRLFVCKCYAYEETLEFVVELCSRNCVAKDFTFAVEIVKNGNVLVRKRRVCLLYQKSVLDSGVAFTHKEFEFGGNISFRVCIKST